MNLNISKHLDANNPHHAYLIEGKHGEIVPEILKFCESQGIKISGNPDFCQLSIDNFKIDEAFDLRAMSSDKGFASAKKIFIICANSISLDAQNVLLKMFEEPIENTHFFLIVPDANALLKTLVSRFYLIKPGIGVGNKSEAEKFITMPLNKRIDFIKELLAEPQEDEQNEIIALDSIRAKALIFLNTLEFLLHKEFLKNYERGRFQPEAGVIRNNFSETLFHFFKVREFLRMPGSSTKTLMESVALITPNFLN